MTEPRIFLVAYADTEGPYAVAFSTREDADAFVASFAHWMRDGFTIIDTTIDQARVVAQRKGTQK